MPDVQFESLLSPIEDNAPSGRDLEYDDTFRELVEAGEDKPETEYGDKIFPARPPDWPTVREKAAVLVTRTHDLRLAVWLGRSGARLSGLAAYVDALRLVHGLLARYWDSVHPLLDASDGNDPTARLNALAPLVSMSAGLADLRVASLTGKRGGLTVREIELAFKAAEPIGSEPVPTVDGVAQAIKVAEANAPGVVADLGAGAALLSSIVSVLTEHVPAASLPDFEPLEKILRILARAAAQGSDGAVAEVAGTAAESSTPRVAANGAMQTREDAMRQLELVCMWLEKNDPSNPAPLLIRRAQRLMQKNFIDIIRDLAPDTLDQIEKLAGISPS